MTSASASPLDPARVAAHGAARPPEVAESFWVSLRYFNAYRIAVAALFVILVLAYGDALALGQRNLRLFALVSALYFVAAAAFHVAIKRIPRHFETQLTLHVCTDIVAIVLLYLFPGIGLWLPELLYK